MAELKYITLFLDRQKEFNMLSDEQAGKLIKGIFEYGATGEELNSDDLTVNILFSVIKAQLDEVANKYDEKCRKNKEIAVTREKKKREAKNTNVIITTQQTTNVHQKARTYTNVIFQARTAPIQRQRLIQKQIQRLIIMLTHYYTARSATSLLQGMNMIILLMITAGRKSRTT